MVNGVNGVDNGRDPWVDRLSEYVDGDLSPRARRRLERHLTTCGECRVALDDLRDLVLRAPTLEVPSEPVHDLWPGIRRRLTPMPTPARGVWWPSGTVSWLVPRLAVGATVIVAAVAATIWLMPARESRESARARPDVPVRTAALDADREYCDTIADLRRVVHSKLTDDPQVVEVLERNLSVLDAAIAEYRDALAAQPGDAGLTGRITAVRQRKLQLLRQAAALAAEGTN